MFTVLKEVDVSDKAIFFAIAAGVKDEFVIEEVVDIDAAIEIAKSKQS